MVEVGGIKLHTECHGDASVPAQHMTHRFGSVANAVAWNFIDTELESHVSARSIKVPVLLLAGTCNTWIGGTLQQQHVSLYTNARLEEIAVSQERLVLQM